MEIQQYVETIHDQLILAAAAGGDDARALAERLVAPLDAALRLAFQDVLAAAAEEITCELAPGSVELRLRGRDPELVVSPPPAESSDEDFSQAGQAPGVWSGVAADIAPGEGAMSRINLRLPDQLKSRIEAAAGGVGLSVNSWLVRAAAVVLERGDLDGRRESRPPRRAQRFTGWAR